MMAFRSISTPAAIGFGVLLAVPAFAAWPASVVGTWNMQANLSALRLSITSQAASGNCRTLIGTLTDTPSGQISNVQGFYCPKSGRIQLLRKNVSTNDTFQVYTGNLSVTGTPTFMAGTFAEDADTPVLGEYNFSASK